VPKIANINEVHPLPEKNRGGLEKRLKKRFANLSSRKNITKKANAGRGQETKWEMSIERRTQAHTS